MTQNMNMAYPNMMNFALNMQAQRPIDAANHFTFQTQQAQRILYPYLINNNLSQPQPQIQTIYNMNTQTNLTNQINQNTTINNIIPENSSTKAETNNLNNNTQNSSTPLKLLTKYKDIYVPSIYLIDYNDTSKPPFNTIISSASQVQQTYNQLTGQVINNNQNNSVLNKYFNYGYNLEQWKAYVNDIKGKFDELNELVKNGVIRLPDPDNELEYLMAFPSDYGGLGNVQNDQNYENVKFYDPKDTTKNQANKNFMSLIKFEHDQIWFPLEPNPSSLNKQFNDINKIKNYPVNPYMKYIFPQNFLLRTSNNIPSTIVPNPEQNNTGNNSSGKNENKKER